MKNIYVVIMAGGSGERFWPKSRKKCPKQLLPIISKKTMLQETIERIKDIVGKDNIFIVTNKVQSAQVKKQAFFVNPQNIIIEPISKNTAPCIAVAAAKIIKKNKNAIMIVLPADHEIKNVEKFQKTLLSAAKISSGSKYLVTLGIRPRSPHTGYGYIQKGKQLFKNAFLVSRFAEKPTFEKAKRYLQSRQYLWNSGMFIWRADAILNEIKKHLPKLYMLIKKYKSEIVYNKAESVSIDYGIMEKTKNAVVIEADFVWDDLGSWSALDPYFKKDKDKNIAIGNVVYKDIENTTIMSEGILVAAVGIKDMVVVYDKGAILICPKNRSEDVKKIVNIMKKENKFKEYL